MKYKTLVIAEKNNCGISLDSFVSSTQITLKRLIEYYEKYEDFDWEKDSITITEKNKPINLDKKLS